MPYTYYYKCIARGLFGATPRERFTHLEAEADDDNDGRAQQRHAQLPRPQGRGGADLASIIRHFGSIMTMFLDLEGYFAITVLGLADHLLGYMLLPLKCVVAPGRAECRDWVALAAMAVGTTAYWGAGLYTTQLYSYLYHGVRRASFIKLVMVFNILDVADKILSSFCYDALEVLYACVSARCGGRRRRATQQGKSSPRSSPVTPLDAAALSASSESRGAPGSSSTGGGTKDAPHASGRLFAASIVAVIVGVSAHAMTLLLSVVTLNVAINAEGATLLALLVGNNLSEIRGAVFKKYTSESLLNVCALDALERLQSILFTLVMLLHHMHERFSDFALRSLLVTLLAEVGIDFTKMLFACRFNGVSLSIFRTCAQLTLVDVASEEVLWRIPAVTVEADSQHPVGGSPAAVAQLLLPSTGFAPKHIRRIGMNSPAYGALLVWSSSRVMWCLAAHAPLIVVLSIVLAVAVKLLLHSLVSGLAARYVLREMIVLPPQKKVQAAGAPPLTVVRISPLLCSLLSVDRFDLQAGKVKK